MENVKSIIVKYKFIFLICVILFLMLYIFILSIFMYPNYDLTVVVAGDFPVANYYNNIENAIKKYADDYNADGKVTINIVPLLITNDPKGKNLYLSENSISKLINNIVLSDTFLYLVDDFVYENVGNGFLNLSDMYPNNPKINGDRFYIFDTKFSIALDIPDFPSDFSFVLKPFHLNDEVGSGNKERFYKYNMEILNRLISNS